ncbi:hypothetical protein [Clostridium beijerinckii]|uniref:Uncharacterized protein n=1 Tax=Clostridium beijerinckii TaxID=1520 RepID=A0AAE5H0V1_CLOBE|nr:hypothetical protein [Clostridium beijerinckii]NSB12121.1 hypothetical protein [Clostridium beijerinckii]OOM27454.1 hypothetical protein CLOBE_30120 [Clostridium beijerinckii]
MSEEEYQGLAIIYIKKYLNNDNFTDDDIKTNHSLAIKRIVMRLKNLDELPQGILSTKSNDVSITYMDNNNVVMTKDIKALLPLPYIKLY